MSEIRKLVAILVADVVGYSRLAGADEDRTLARRASLAALAPRCFFAGAQGGAFASKRKICNSIFSRSKTATSKKRTQKPRLTVPRSRNG